MPIYEYQCADCGERDQRVAGLDDHTALCTHCGGLMLRLDEDIFLPYFATAPPAPIPEPAPVPSSPGPFYAEIIR